MCERHEAEGAPEIWGGRSVAPLAFVGRCTHGANRHSALLQPPLCVGAVPAGEIAEGCLLVHLLRALEEIADIQQAVEARAVNTEKLRRSLGRNGGCTRLIPD